MRIVYTGSREEPRLGRWCQTPFGYRRWVRELVAHLAAGGKLTRSWRSTGRMTGRAVLGDWRRRLIDRDLAPSTVNRALAAATSLLDSRALLARRVPRVNDPLGDTSREARSASAAMSGQHTPPGWCFPSPAAPTGSGAQVVQRGVSQAHAVRGAAAPSAARLRADRRAPPPRHPRREPRPRRRGMPHQRARSAGRGLSVGTPTRSPSQNHRSRRVACARGARVGHPTLTVTPGPHDADRGRPDQLKARTCRHAGHQRRAAKAPEDARPGRTGERLDRFSAPAIP